LDEGRRPRDERQVVDDGSRPEADDAVRSGALSRLRSASVVRVAALKRVRVRLRFRVAEVDARGESPPVAATNPVADLVRRQTRLEGFLPGEDRRKTDGVRVHVHRHAVTVGCRPGSQQTPFHSHSVDCSSTRHKAAGLRRVPLQSANRVGAWLMRPEPRPPDRCLLGRAWSSSAVG